MSTDLLNLSSLDSLREKLRARMSGLIIDLIPEDKLDELTSIGLDEFINGPRAYRFQTSTEYLLSDDPRNTTGKDGFVSFLKELPAPMKNNQPYIVAQDPNTLPGIIASIMRDIAKEMVTKRLETARTASGHYENMGFGGAFAFGPGPGEKLTPNEMIDKAVAEMIKEAGPKYLEYFINSVVRNMFLGMMNQNRY